MTDFQFQESTRSCFAIRIDCKQILYLSANAFSQVMAKVKVFHQASWVLLLFLFLFETLILFICVC